MSLVVVVGSPYGSYWTTDFGGYVDSTAHSVGSPSTTTTTRHRPRPQLRRHHDDQAPTTTTRGVHHDDQGTDHDH